MEPADTIRKRGFRRWYEHQLYESFTLLVTGFVSLIMMAIALEATEFRASASGLLALVSIAFVGGGVCVFAWRRFHRQLLHAEYLADTRNLHRLRRVCALRRAPDARRPATPAGCSLDVLLPQMRMRGGVSAGGGFGWRARGGALVTRGGIYNTQYAAWVAGGYVPLNIANYRPRCRSASPQFKSDRCKVCATCSRLPTIRPTALS